MPPELLQCKLAEIEHELAQRGGVGELARLYVNRLTQGAFVISDPTLPDNLLVYVSDEFERLSNVEAIGRNRLFLQVSNTHQLDVRIPKKIMRSEQNSRLVLRNYRNDGAPFLNEIYPPAIPNTKSFIHL